MEHLNTYFNWLEEVIKQRLMEIDTNVCNDIDTSSITNIDKFGDYSYQEIIIILLAVAPIIKPQALDTLLNKVNQKTMKSYTQIGGTIGQHHNGVIPTIQTALFVLAGKDLSKRIEYLQQFFQKDSLLIQNGVIEIFKNLPQEPFNSATIKLSEEHLYELFYNKPYEYQYSDEFPARLYTTEEEWEDLILPDRTTYFLQDIRVWLTHYTTLIQDPFFKKYTKGMKFLFYGEPGTGKSVCVALYGKQFKKPVYRIDLSQVVSKWVGETSKNIGKIFDIAKNKDWILFFDEGDALFGKRTETDSANDRYGNQEIAYLLQRIEEHEGIIFMATNKLPNMDKAFVRRFNARAHFPIPDIETRYKIWLQAFEHIHTTANLSYFASKVDNSGASIRSFARYCTLWMLENGLEKLNHDDTTSLLRSHLEHEGRVWSPK